MVSGHHFNSVVTLTSLYFSWGTKYGEYFYLVGAIDQWCRVTALGIHTQSIGLFSLETTNFVV